MRTVLNKAIQTLKALPLRRHWLVFGGISLVAWLVFVHPDVVETANHSYLLLDDIFSGRVLQFYNDVMARPYGASLYYTNYAHYNILVYLLFALAELPLYLFNALTGVLREVPIWYTGKLVSFGFFVACIVQVQRLAQDLGFSRQDSHLSALFFALMPPAFFSAVVMGQYDTICLFFILLGLRRWLQGDLWGCALLLGAGAAAKFFSLFLLVPLVLLAEKRPLHILKYGAVSLWLLLPTTLLFWGRTGDMGAFTGQMIARLFGATLQGAFSVPLFPLCFFLLCVVAYAHKPPTPQRRAQSGLWLCLAAFGLLFFFTLWHPQWLVLIAPFMVLTTFSLANRRPWFFVDIAFSAGTFILCALQYGNALEANLFNWGTLGRRFGLALPAGGYTPIYHYLEIIPLVAALPMVLFGGALAAHLLLKLPVGPAPLADRLCNETTPPPRQLPAWAWLVFGVGLSVWLLPTLYSWLGALL